MRCYLALLATVFAPFLSSCGNSSNGLPSERPAGILSGVAYDGLVVDGKVAVYSFGNGSKGDLLAVGSSDFQGFYKIELKAPDQPILIEIASGRYIEEASGANVPLRGGQVLRAVNNYISGLPITINATFYTTLAAGLAEYKIKTGAEVKEAVEQANATLSTLLALDITKVVPKDITNRANASAFLSAELEYGFFAGALSKWTAYASKENKDSTAHENFSSIAFVQIAYDDIKHDGLLNGVGGIGNLSFGVLPLGTDVYRNELAVQLLKMSQDARNQTGISPSKLLSTALRLNNSTEGIFGAVPLVKLDGDGPVFTAVTPTADMAIHGTFIASATVVDILGLTAVEFYVDDVLVGAAADPSNPELAIDTKRYVDGTHALTVKAINLAGTMKTNTTNVFVSNKQTSISNIVPAVNSYQRGTITAMANVTDSIGVQSVEFLIDGTSVGFAVDIATPTVLLDTSKYADGTHTLTVKAKNTVGNVVSKDVLFIMDNTAPVFITATPAAQTYLTGKITVSATAVDTHLAALEFFVDGASIGLAADKNAATQVVTTTAYADGAHTLGIQASDLAGGLTIKTISLYFDNTAPVITDFYPLSGTVVRGEFDIGANVSDLKADINEFFLDGVHHAYAGGSIPRSFVNTLGLNLSDGVHTIMIKATDTVGLVSTASINVVVDNTPPVTSPLAVTYIGSSSLKPCVVGATTFDTGSGVAVVTANGSVVATGTQPWSFTIPAPPNKGNSWCGSGAPVYPIVNVIEKDKAGNVHQFKVANCADAVVLGKSVCKIIQ